MSRLRQETGSALVAVMGVMFVLSILAIAVTGVATNSSRYAVQDQDSKRALSAAVAGLQTATYRIDNLQPDASHCITNVLATPTVGSDCTITESIGNGASYTYWDSIAGTSCGQLPGATDPSGSERCITAAGTVNGQTRRVQERVVVQPTTPPYFPAQGMVGLAGIDVGNNANIAGDVASNGPITFGNNDAISGAAYLGPSGSFSGGPPAGGTRSHGAFTPPAVPIAGTETANNNGSLTVAQGYTASTRSLILTGDVTLAAGDYNFCRLDIGGNTISVSGPVRIFIDAPNSLRSGSGCPENAPPSGTNYGTVAGWNGATLNAGGRASNFQMFVQGWPTSGSYASTWGVNTIDLGKNGVTASAMIYAPDSAVTAGKNNASFTGGILASQITLKNNLTFSWDSSLNSVGASGANATRQGWFECKPVTPNPAVPESGC